MITSPAGSAQVGRPRSPRTGTTGNAGAATATRASTATQPAVSTGLPAAVGSCGFLDTSKRRASRYRLSAAVLRRSSVNGVGGLIADELQDLDVLGRVVLHELDQESPQRRRRAPPSASWPAA